MIIPALSEALAATAVPPALATNVELSAIDFAPLFAEAEEGGHLVTGARSAPRAAGAADCLATAAGFWAPGPAPPGFPAPPPTPPPAGPRAVPPARKNRPPRPPPP